MSDTVRKRKEVLFPAVATIKEPSPQLVAALDEALGQIEAA
jgi:hypothetical protein